MNIILSPKQHLCKHTKQTNKTKQTSQAKARTANQKSLLSHLNRKTKNDIIRYASPFPALPSHLLQAANKYQRQARGKPNLEFPALPSREASGKKSTRLSQILLPKGKERSMYVLFIFHIHTEIAAVLQCAHRQHHISQSGIGKIWMGGSTQLGLHTHTHSLSLSLDLQRLSVPNAIINPILAQIPVDNTKIA